MGDRVCIRGCMQRQHFADCPDYGKEDGVCRGCVPAEAREGSLICDRCFGRTRRMITDAPDLLGRIRSLGDPTKARAYDQVGTGAARNVEAPAPIPADLIDAGDAIAGTLRAWASMLEHRGWDSRGLPAGADAADAYEEAHGNASVILDELPKLANDQDMIIALTAAALDLHPAVDGIRERWSIADAMYRWNVERPTEAFVEVQEEAEEIRVGGVSEWGNPLLTRREAAGLVGVSEPTLRRWVRDGDLTPAATLRVGSSKHTWFRSNAVREAASVVEARRGKKKETGMKCPECRDGKPQNCIGWTLDGDDNEVPCGGASSDHQFCSQEGEDQ